MKLRIPNLLPYNSEKNSFSNSPNATIITSTQSDLTPISIKTNHKKINEKFNYLKQKLNITSFRRKTQIDSLLKKCKSKAVKNIDKAVSKCLKIRIPRLPQEFITNIKIEYNKFFLKQTILSIYKHNNLFSSFEELKNNKVIIDKNEENLRIFLSLTFCEVFEYYINSKQFIKDYLKISRREGEKFAYLFLFVAKNFITYFSNRKGNKSRFGKRLGLSKRTIMDIKDKKANDNNLVYNDKNIQIFNIEKINKY